MRLILILTALLAFQSAAASPFDETKALAGQGDVRAQYNLGLMYADGDGVPENGAEAVKWYRKAAEQGDADAQYNLGYMYADGLGVPENGAEAVKWFRKAAAQGDADAQSKLGFMYGTGKGVPENSIRAYVWFSMAKTQGDTGAATNIDILKSDMTPQQIADGQALATKCYESAYKDCD
jgi:TPR repeat protein